jgi:nucleotide-binding universal stress UspA family protein
MLLRRIIAPVTFADDSLEAAELAAELAVAVGAELVLAGIAPLAQLDRADGIDDPAGAARQAQEQQLVDRIVRERMLELAATLPAALRTRTLLIHGPVGAALVDAAGEEQADLVVVPIRRARRIAHLLHDHADHYVLHHSGVPVLVVPTDGGAMRHQPSREAA